MPGTPCSALINGICTNGFIARPGCAVTEKIGPPYLQVACLSEILALRDHPDIGKPTDEQVRQARERARDPR